jgi:hypothetical protein
VKQYLVATGAIVIALTAAASASAAGEEAALSVEEIKAAEVDFNKGREAYKGGNYVEAAEYFESADGHAPNDRVLELAINAREKAGNSDRAATLAQLGLDTYPTSDRLRKVAAPLVDKARTELLQVTIQCDQACNLLDGARLVHGPAATRRVVFLTPGDHTIRAAWSDDRAASKNVTGKAGESTTLEFVAPPIPKKPEVAAAATAAPGPVQDHGVEEKPHGMSPTVFFIGAGATVVLGGLTVWSGIDTVNNPGADKVREECSKGLPDCQTLYDQGRAHQLRTNLLIGATSVVGVATAIVGAFFTNWSGESSESTAATASVSPWVSYQNGPAVGAVGRF